MTRPRDSNLGSSALEADALPLGQRGGEEEEAEDSTVELDRLIQTTKLTLLCLHFNDVFIAIHVYTSEPTKLN